MPTNEQVEQVLVRLIRPQERTYFFDRLTNPEWVAPLAERGVFRNLPAPEEAEEPGYVRFPAWDEGRYLVRVAKDASPEVTEAIRGADPAENPSNVRVLFEIAFELQRADLASLGKDLVRWAATPFIGDYSDAASALTGRLFELGLAREAEELLIALLQPSDESRLQLDAWHYERFLQRVTPSGIEHGGFGFFRRLLRMLSASLPLDPEGRDSDTSHSYLWRPAIGDHEQNNSERRGFLVAAIRDAAVALIADETAEEIRSALSSDLLSKRIWIHVVSRWTGGAGEADRLIREDDVLADYRLTHETAELLRAHFASLGSAATDRVFAWIDGDSADDDLDDLQKRRRRLNRYSFIRDALSSERLAEFESLVDELGEPSPTADFLTYAGTFAGSTSPLDPAVAASMTPAALAEFAASWAPDSGFAWPPAPSIDGLAATVRVAVKERPDLFSSEAMRFSELEPTIVRSVLNGFDDALRGESQIAWGSVFELCASVAAHPFEEGDPGQVGDGDPGFRWARGAVTDLLRTAFDAQHLLSPSWRATAWNLIVRLVADPNPDEAHEERYGGDNMDGFTLSLNTNRGKAVNAAVKYGLWLHRNDDSVEIPELFALIDTRLDEQVERSVAVRSAIGRWFPWLQLLNPQWAEARATSVFGAPESPSRLGLAAWASFLAYTEPYDSVYGLLAPWYRAAIDRGFDAEFSAGRGHEPGETVGEHVAALAWRGVAPPDVYLAFLDEATDSLAGRVVRFIGRAVANSSEVAPQILDRLQAIWEQRLPVLEDAPTDHAAEIQAFGSWVASGKFDPDWSLPHFGHALSMAGVPQDSYAVLDMLATTSVQPGIALRALVQMTSQRTNAWDPVSWRESAKVIVERAIEAGSSRAEVEDVIDFFVRSGDHSFRHLMPPQ